MSRCLRCGADSSWLEGAAREPAVNKRDRANSRRQLSAWIRRFDRIVGLDTSDGGLAERILPTLRSARKALGGR